VTRIRFALCNTAEHISWISGDYLGCPDQKKGDIFLGSPERARAETGGADQWVLKRRECSGFARVNKVTSASLGYLLSVFNKNSTLKARQIGLF